MNDEKNLNSYTQDFQKFEDWLKEFSKNYKHINYDKFNNFLNKYNNIKTEGHKLRDQEKYEQALRKYKSAFRYTNIMINMKERAEHKEKFPNYYRNKKRLLTLAVLLFIIFISLIPVIVILKVNLILLLAGIGLTELFISILLICNLKKAR